MLHTDTLFVPTYLYEAISGVAKLSNELCLFTFCIKHETFVEISAMLRLFQCEITFSYFCSATPNFF